MNLNSNTNEIQLSKRAQKLMHKAESYIASGKINSLDSTTVFYVLKKMKKELKINVDAKVIHYPNLKTVIMVEEVIKKSDVPLTKEAIKQKLPTKIMHQTLNLILDYLEDSNKIITNKKKIIWIFNKVLNKIEN